MAVIDFDYIDIKWDDGSTRVLPFQKGTTCQGRPASVSDLSPAQLASVLLARPTLPAGYAYRAKGCDLGWGPWRESSQQPSFIADANQPPSGDGGVGVIINDPADQSGEELFGNIHSNTQL